MSAVCGRDVDMPVNVDAERIVQDLNVVTGAGLSVEGVASHGDTGGAVYVRWPDGRGGVVTPSVDRVEDLQRTADVLALVRSLGLPVPRYELIACLRDCVAVVQERLPGKVMRLDVPKLEAMVEMNQRFEGILARRHDVPSVRYRLQDKEWHRSLEEYSDRSRVVLSRIRRTGDPEMFGDDLVHLDFNAENVLFDEDGAITGVIDWGGSASRGDRRFALVKLRCLLAWETLAPPGPDPAVLARLDELLGALIEPETLHLYWAEWSVRMLNWTIRNYRPVDVELFLDLAATRLA